MNTIKRLNHFKVISSEYKPWDMRKVVETFSGKTYKKVMKEQKEKHENTV